MNAYLKKNYNNLLDLWHCYGAENRNGLWFSMGWPHRVWHPTLDIKQTLQCLKHYLLNTQQQLVMVNAPGAMPPSAIEEWQANMSLTLMHLTIPQTDQILADGAYLELLDSHDEIGLGAFKKMCSEGFGYPMEVAPLQRAAREKGVQLGFLCVHGQRVATVLFYQQGTTVGVFQVTVPSIFRGKGYAREAILQSMKWAKEQGAELMTLQASEMGLRLYRQLGFEETGSLTFWRR